MRPAAIVWWPVSGGIPFLLLVGIDLPANDLSPVRQGPQPQGRQTFQNLGDWYSVPFCDLSREIFGGPHHGGSTIIR